MGLFSKPDFGDEVRLCYAETIAVVKKLSPKAFAKFIEALKKGYEANQDVEELLDVKFDDIDGIANQMLEIKNKEVKSNASKKESKKQ